METTDIMPYSTVKAMVENWETVQGKIRMAEQLLGEAKETVTTVFDKIYYSHSHSDINAEMTISEMRKGIWRSLMEKTEIVRFLSISRRKEIENEIEKGSMPELTIENVIAMVKSAVANVQTYADEMVIEVYNILRPYDYNGYTSNKTFALGIGKKAILGWAVEKKWNGGGYRAIYKKENELRAVDNVFHALDGNGFSASNRGEIVDAIDEGKTETKYFRFKCYANNNLHLEFKRLDLVQKMNVIVSENTLTTDKDGMKRHMTPEEYNEWRRHKEQAPAKPGERRERYAGLIPMKAQEHTEYARI